MMSSRPSKRHDYEYVVSTTILFLDEMDVITRVFKEVSSTKRLISNQRV